MSRRVEIAPPAERQLEPIDRWWLENRTAAPDLLLVGALGFVAHAGGTTERTGAGTSAWS